MMGVFASMAGFSEDVYRAAAAFIGHRRGGLAYATIGGSAAFGADLRDRAPRRQRPSQGGAAANARPRLFAGFLDRRDSRRWHAQIADPALAGDDHLLRRGEDVYPGHVRRRHHPGADDHRVQPRRYRHYGPTPSANSPGQRSSSLGRALDRDATCGPVADTSHWGIRRHLQRHLYSQRSRVGRRRACFAVCACAPSVKLEVAGSRHVRSGLGHGHVVFNPDGRADLHLFHQSGACA